MLRNAGLKATRQRAAVLRVLAESEEPLAAQDVHRLLRRRIEADLSTVYRSLESMAEKGLLLKTVLSGESRTLFEFNRMLHRHYLVCVGCKKIQPIDHCPLEDYERSLEAQTGYRILSHKLAVYGRCPACAKAGDKP